MRRVVSMRFDARGSLEPYRVLPRHVQCRQVSMRFDARGSLEQGR